MAAGAIIALVVIIVLAVLGGNALYTGYVNSIDYNAKIGGYFDFADRASDVPTKIHYMQLYVDAIKKEGLDEGCNSVLNCGQPAAQNAENYRIALSLLHRLENNTKIDSDYARIYDLQTTIWTEFCWFPDQAFEQGYQIKHNNWGGSLFPPGQVNHCPTSGSSKAPPPPTS